MPYFKIVWSRGTYLSEDGSATWKLLRDFVSSNFVW
jgi:hypothetical protein